MRIKCRQEQNQANNFAHLCDSNVWAVIAILLHFLFANYLINSSFLKFYAQNDAKGSVFLLEFGIESLDDYQFKLCSFWQPFYVVLLDIIYLMSKGNSIYKGWGRVSNRTYTNSEHRWESNMTST